MKKTPIAMAVAAAFGLPTANSATEPVYLQSGVAASMGAPTALLLCNSTATWSYDTVTGVVTATGMASQQSQISPLIPGQVFTRDTVDLAWGGGAAATAASFDCADGSFSNAVFASFCGNYNFGANYLNESTTTWGPGLAFSRTLGGDDVALGAQQSITEYDGGTTTDLGDTIEVTNIDPPITSGQRFSYNRPGDAVDDPIGTTQGSMNVVIPIGSNDVRWPTPALGVDQNVTGPATGSDGGSFVINSDPDMANVTVSYTPVNPTYTGTETWTYTVTDTSDSTCFIGGVGPNPDFSSTNGVSDMAMVTVTVSQPGTANPDNASTTRLLAPVDINVGANDSFDPMAATTVTVIAGPTQGTTTVSNNGGTKDNVVVTYQSTAAPGTAPYTDTFTYRIEQGATNDTADVMVMVNNLLPVAGDLGGITLDTQGVSPSTVSTDIDVGPGGDIAGNALGDAPSVVMTSPANDVTTAVNGTVITITASAFTSAGDAVGYTITDADTEADIGTIAVSIPDVSPTVSSVSETIAFAGAFTVTMPFTAGNGAVSDHSLDISQPQFGTIDNVVVDVGVITFDYTPGGFSGPDVITVSLTDGDGSVGTGTATLTMTGSAVTIPPQDSLPGSSSSLSPATLGLLLSIPLLLRGRRRKRED